MIGILDYGMGNLHSVASALKRLGVDGLVSSKQSHLEETDGLILPGVGAFKDAMNLLHADGHVEFIKDYAKRKPLLGICLGMQLLFNESEEHGLTEGLELLPGRVRRFPAGGYKVPHMGWNELIVYQPQAPLIKHLKADYAYFVHSYYVETEDKSLLIATADYGIEVPAIVGRGKVFGTQFHPEKSGEFGLNLLSHFCQLSERGVIYDAIYHLSRH
ncbi:glutamine amidotransferase [Scopulibacillus daqui]|uniref:Imidazole glycerol phosphate synthase subunit HisH n=1 Tax=Scopulibacillus daqui TaxID=1469162 RepID=A0ABS2PZY6_9BACL|nr:imidazole glycerol phosphate synthase subunit HisH [Scopulibacillus daqui]MBM7645004.1 glutamine amidotransferase [Scopulibacillus daqui]